MMRFFAMGDNDDNRNDPKLSTYALQSRPGVYNETVRGAHWDIPV